MTPKHPPQGADRLRAVETERDHYWQTLKAIAVYSGSPAHVRQMAREAISDEST